MPIQDLLELVDTLRKRIDEHGVALRSSEALTRYALIDPLLRGLGWDTADPKLVIPEFNSGSGRADYALLSNGKPLIMLEAKSLGSQLEQAAVQGINYCNIKGTAFFCVSNGRKWKLYETFRPTPIEEKIVVSWDIGEGNGADACLKAMALWRPNAMSGNIAITQHPVVGLPLGQIESFPPIPPPSPAFADGDWQSLTAVDVKQAQKVLEIQFPDRKLIELKRKTWVTTVKEIVKWLIDNGNLNETNCPIKSHKKKSKHNLVNTKPVHQDGKPFGWSTEINGIHVKHYGYLHDNRDAAVTIIRHLGMDPTQFKVSIS